MPAPGDQHRVGPPGTMNGAITANPFEEPQQRISAYTAQEIATLQARLDKKLGPEYISARPGAAGQKVHYLSADKCINLANEVFGFNGWSSSIQNIQIDFVEESQHTGKISLGLSVIVRVTLKDGTFHEDIGYGHIENCKGKAAAFEKAKKEGTTDALKRALRNFGNVLGNCIYDKEYVAKVTKVKTNPARWDVDDLHRHPDFAPIKKELAPPKKMPEDDDLPPRPADVNKSSNSNDSAIFDGDGEFGSDLFDEADFGVTDNGNPDEISLEPEPYQQQPPTPMQGQHAQRRPQEAPRFQGRPNPTLVTPSKPERSWSPAPVPRQQQPVTQNDPSMPNGRPALFNQPGNYMGQNKPASVQMPQQNLQNGRMPPQPQLRPNQNSMMQGTGGQAEIKKEPGFNANENKPRGPSQDTLPPAGSPGVGAPSTGFFSARAVDLLRDNPNAVPSAAPQFDPHAESPSIRKTAGVDHSKTVPIRKPMLAGASPASNNTRDFVNPSADMHRKIGAPGGGGVGSPMNRGPSTSSYRPLTRPNIDPRNPANGQAMNRAAVLGPQNINGKRPPLNDVTNATTTPGNNGAPSASVAGDPKRVRFNDGPNPGLPQQQQQPPQS